LPVTRTDLEFGDKSTAPVASTVNLSIAAVLKRSMHDIRRRYRGCELCVPKTLSQTNPELAKPCGCAGIVETADSQNGRLRNRTVARRPSGPTIRNDCRYARSVGAASLLRADMISEGTGFIVAIPILAGLDHEYIRI